MVYQAEIDRIDEGKGHSGPVLDPLWEFALDLGEDPDRTLTRILEVVRKIVSQDDDRWPQDAYWKENLPSWLINSMPEISKEEADRLMAATPREKLQMLPWTFGSWLDAMRDRGWRWWGYEVSGRKAKIVLRVTSIPPRIGAFKQLLRSAGANISVDRSI